MVTADPTGGFEMFYRDLFLGLSIALALVGFVLCVIAPMMASTPAEVVTLGAALMIVCLGVIAIGLKLGKPDVQV
jgi:hypothetical protein